MDGNIKEIVLLALEPIYPSKPITLSNPNRKLMKKKIMNIVFGGALYRQNFLKKWYIYCIVNLGSSFLFP